MTRRQKKIVIKGAVIGLFVCLLSELVMHAGWPGSLQTQVYDLYHRAAGARSGYTPHAVIVSIDSRTLAHLDQDPLVFWGPHFARVISGIRKAGAKSIGIDLTFHVSPDAWLQKMNCAGSEVLDTAFQEQLFNSNTVLSGQVIQSKDGRHEFILPRPEYLYALKDGPASIGLTNFFQDPDGAVRQFSVRFFNDGKKPDTAFAPLLVEKAGMTHGFDGMTRIGYVGPPGTVPRVSFMDLLSTGPAYENAMVRLKGKIAIICLEQGGFGDLHLTPYTGGFFSGSMNLMSGGEVHANIIETIITGRYPRPLPAGLRVFWLGGCILLTIGLTLRRGGLWGGAAAGGIIFLTALVSGGLFLNGLLAPVVNVAAAAGLSYLGALALRLGQEETERRRVRAVFASYVSEPVLADIMKTDTMPVLGGQEIEVTALFSDIRNFTGISEKLAPGEVVEFLNEYYSRICKDIMDHHGIVDKFIGDAVMAVFGVPVAGENHADQSIQAAVSMMETAQQFTHWFSRRFPGRKIPGFRIGIGIHSGPALVGNIGTPQRMEYTAIGDTVNIASRLEGLCKTLGWSIVASQATIERASVPVVTGDKKKIQPKGRAAAIDVAEVIRVDRNGGQE